MKNCDFKAQIDDYLLNRLEGAAKDEFEEHYFNCPECFRLTEEREALVSAIKGHGARIFAEEAPARQREWVPAWRRAMASFSPRQWATVGVAAAVLAVAVFGILPRFRQASPQFVLSESEVVRGASLTLLTPVIDVKALPSYFEWTGLGQDVEYKIFVYNSTLLWTQTTKENKVAIPEEVKILMTAGQKYSWQVKAFSPKGALIAVSSRVQFQITPEK